MRFEAQVRKDLESRGFIISKWQNNVELSNKKEKIEGRLVPARQGKYRLTSTGFPDFIIFRRIELQGHGRHKFPKKIRIREVWGYSEISFPQPMYAIVGVECKFNGYLSKEEKAKCEWLLENNIFSKILIAKKGKGGIVYEEWDAKREN